MKLQCDVCSSEEASVFCCADEAALCGSCDRRVHSANKLASKHRRLSLLHPNSHAPTLCDICQERGGLLFCQDDRAILCRDCDLSIHSKNRLTAKHNRYLLTGAGLSSSPIPATEAGAVLIETSSNISNQIFDLQKVEARLEEEVPCTMSNSSNNSSISEYLINTLPGWHVEDFLFDDDAAATTSTATANSFDHQADETVLFTERSSEQYIQTLPIWQHHSAGVSECVDNVLVAKEARNGQRRKRRSQDGLMVPSLSLSEWLQLQET